MVPIHLQRLEQSKLVHKSKVISVFVSEVNSEGLELLLILEDLRIDLLVVKLFLAQMADIKSVLAVRDLLLKRTRQILELDVSQLNLRNVGQLPSQDIVFLLLLRIDGINLGTLDYGLTLSKPLDAF